MCNTSTGIYLMLYKSQADKRIPTVDSYLYTSAGIETKDFQSPSTHTACASHRCRVYRLLHGKVSAQGSQQKPAVSRIYTRALLLAVIYSSRSSTYADTYESPSFTNVSRALTRSVHIPCMVLPHLIQKC